ncbi:hypothetical protein GCM10009527_096780 [Actinomadura nitritigenes]|uniref:Uncharacterized protein n=1 Tax=Actinomadura nitritigenes TaxID=134602 RepID=A0ABS3RGJ8_9ACTN|nr:hypothetical protein [Actinomadura nitritigenes]
MGVRAVLPTATVTANGTMFLARTRLDTPREVDYCRNGGIPYVLRQLLAGKSTAEAIQEARQTFEATEHARVRQPPSRTSRHCAAEDRCCSRRRGGPIGAPGKRRRRHRLSKR